MTNPVGRPLKYKTPEELETAINEYFDFCDARVQKSIVKRQKQL